MKTKTIAVLNGPNLAALGAREPQHYGTQTLEELEAFLKKEAQALGAVELMFFQSNHEGALIDALYAAKSNGVAGIVFNPGALAHTSIGLHDAVAALQLPVIEVHLSQVLQRAQLDPVRRPLVVAPACQGVLMGLGFQGYALALRALVNK